jgi:PleD family two-component response regulator
VKSNDIIL